MFLAADVSHIRALASSGKIFPDSVHNYAQGRLVLFAPRRTDIHTLADLKQPSVKKIGIAKPELAPYGKATVDALTKAGLWQWVEPKVVYGQNISAVVQFVDSSNVDAAFTALALVYDRPGNKIAVDGSLHAPITQALGILASTSHGEAARRVAAWLVSQEGQTLFTQAGYGIATQEPDSASSSDAPKLNP